MWLCLGVSLGGAALLYALVAAALFMSGRQEAARAAATFVPDCLILFQRLLRDPCVPRRAKLVLAALVGYLALPFDLVPDFIPVAGAVDDGVLVVFVLRRMLRRTGPECLRQHWPGPPASLALVLRLAAASPHEGPGSGRRWRIVRTSGL
jgi:uncharacterized membrane protein YkvA (DUF1232 family)